MSYSVQCTHCQAALKSAKPLRVGKNVKCPKCQQPFTVESSEPKPPHPNPIPPVPEALSEDDEMAAAIAKLQAEQTGARPALAAAPKPAAAPVQEVDVAEVDDDLEPDSEAKRAPAKKKKPPPGDDDEAPRLEKKRDDEDEEEDDRAGPRKKKAKKGGNAMLLIGIVGGGFLVLLLCFGCGGAAVYLSDRFLPPDIVGKWENAEFVKLVYEFRADGTGSLNAGLKIDFRYRQQGSKLTLQPTGMRNLGVDGAKMDGLDESHFLVRREGDTLILQDELKGIDIRLRKIP